MFVSLVKIYIVFVQVLALSLSHFQYVWGSSFVNASHASHWSLLAKVPVVYLALFVFHGWGFHQLVFLSD